MDKAIQILINVIAKVWIVAILGMIAKDHGVTPLIPAIIIVVIALREAKRVIDILNGDWYYLV